MSKVCFYLAVLIGLFAMTFAGGRLATASADIDPGATYKEGLETEKTDLEGALTLYCTAARQGYGRAQYEVGRIYASRPGKQADEDKGGRRDIAAAMMWLDMAIINKVTEAKLLRRTLGGTAREDDFSLYGQFTRQEIGAPCQWDEVYKPPEELKTSD